MNAGMEAASHSLGGHEPKPKKEIHEIRTRKGKSGGYIHEHHHKSPMHHPMEEHTSPDQAAMMQHMAESMPQAAPADPAADPAASAAPAGAAPAAPATPGMY